MGIAPSEIASTPTTNTNTTNATRDSGSMMAAYTVSTLVTSVALRASAPRYASRISAIRRSGSGPQGDGFTTTEHPMASAGAILRVSIALGKFQGVMQATTPTGCLMTTTLLSSEGAGIVSP